MKQQLTGWLLVLAGVAMAFQSIGDDIAALQNLQGWYSNGQFIGTVMKHLGTVVLSMLGGLALPYNLQDRTAVRTRSTDPAPADKP